MPLDLAVNINTAGCQLSAVVSSHNKVTGEIDYTLEEADEALNTATSILEAIKYTANVRMLEVYNFGDYFEPGVWQRVMQVLEVWAGRIEPGQVIANWQSIREENAALEADRQRYMENQMALGIQDNGADDITKPFETATYTVPNRYGCPNCNASEALEHSQGCGR